MSNNAPSPEDSASVSETGVVDWIARGAMAGIVIGTVEAMLALVSGVGLALSYAAGLVGVYVVVGVFVGAALGILAPRRVSVGGSVSRLVTALACSWGLERAVHAATFRGLSVGIGVAAALLGAVGLFRLVLFLSNRLPPTASLELTLALTALLVALWLAGGRHLAQRWYGAVFSAGGLTLAVLTLVVTIILVRIQFGVVSGLGASWSAWRVACGATALSVVLVPLTWFTVTGLPSNASSPRPVLTLEREYKNVILVSIDTLRADRLGVYGYSRNVSPRIDAFASESELYLNALSTSSWTVPAHASMLTGLYPRRHGAHFVGEELSGPEWYYARPLSESNVTLAELLSSKGYRTAAFVSNMAALSSSMGFDQGFDIYDDRAGRVFGYQPVGHRLLEFLPYVRDCVSKSYREAEAVNRSVFEWLDQSARSQRPFFLFVNYMEPHVPFCAPKPFDEKYGRPDPFVSEPADAVFKGDGMTPNEVRHFRGAYDGEIAYLDSQIGELFDYLDALGIYHDSLIIVTSDHGEYFGEHDMWGHEYGPFDPVYRVPLMVRYPRRERRGVRKEYVQTLDLAPTILSELGLPVPDHFDGAVLGERDEALVVEQYPNAAMAKYHGERFARSYRGVYVYPWKYVRFSDDERHLYDIAADPLEAKNLANKRADVVARLDVTLEDFVSSKTPFEEGETEVEADPELLEKLRALGYVN